VQREDVRVVEPGRDFDFAQEPVGPECGGELGVENLERHGAVVFPVVGKVNSGHAAAAELPLDFVLVS
jgi:hypothetical protein